MHLPNTLTDVDILAQGKEALRSAEFVRKIFCTISCKIMIIPTNLVVQVGATVGCNLPGGSWPHGSCGSASWR